MFLIIGICVLLLLVLLLAARAMKIWEMEQENERLQSYMMSMEEFYAGIQSKIDATRKYRHDLAKHIQTLETFLMKCERPEIMQEYMDNLKERYDRLKVQQFGNDEIVNSILMIKMEQCREKQIPFQIKVKDCIYSGIDEMDLVSLLHNLLDNAIESNERIEGSQEKGIWLFMKKSEGKILIEIKNHFLKGENVTFHTKKADREKHGIGTKIIANIIEKYDGSRTFCQNDGEGIFEDRIELYIK